MTSFEVDVGDDGVGLSFDCESAEIVRAAALYDNAILFMICEGDVRWLKIVERVEVN